MMRNLGVPSSATEDNKTLLKQAQSEQAISISALDFRHWCIPLPFQRREKALITPPDNLLPVSLYLAVDESALRDEKIEKTEERIKVRGLVLRFAS